VARADDRSCASQVSPRVGGGVEKRGAGGVPNKIEQRGQVRIVEGKLAEDEDPETHSASPHVCEVSRIDRVHVPPTHLRREERKSSLGVAGEP
jgi:hypothetical protein